MHERQSIRAVGSIFSKGAEPLPKMPGVYAFWWLGDREKLLTSNRQVVLRGPRKQLVNVEYRSWWPTELEYPCLYVGKTTNIKGRFSLHIKRGCPGRLHRAHPENWKVKPSTTSCQLRWGIEHIFPQESSPLTVIFNNVGFSYRIDFPDNAIAERFFEEDRLVGLWRPWFNIDSER
jgi:hypothetical protein